MSDTIPLVTLEEHFISQAVIDYYAAQGVETSLPDLLSFVMTSLREVGPNRLKSMDNGRVSLQVISHRPNAIAVPPDVCTKANNELHEAIQASPSPNRFAAFAMLPMLHPQEAAQELDRCVSQLCFVGSLIDNTADGRYYDDEFFWPVFEAHERLDVPVYLHAALSPVTADTPSPFHGNYPPEVSNFLANHGFGWHGQVALHVLRLFASKLFDRHQRLKLVLGHMGETLPFLVDRIHKVIQRTWPAAARPRRHLLQVWHENLYITTAGMFTLAPMACLIHMCCADKVLYSVDYPFCSNEEGLEFIAQLKASGMITHEDFLAIAYKNAERLLGLAGRAEEVGVGMADGDEAAGSPERQRRQPASWLKTADGGGEDGVELPHSPLRTVKEEKENHASGS